MSHPIEYSIAAHCPRAVRLGRQAWVTYFCRLCASTSFLAYPSGLENLSPWYPQCDYCPANTGKYRVEDRIQYEPMVVCWACGKEVLERDGYCEKCGFFLRDGSAVEVWVDHKGNVVDWDELIRNWEEEIKGKEGKKAGDVKLCIGVL